VKKLRPTGAAVHSKERRKVTP